MPFGIKTAPNAFQWIIDKVVRGCRGTIAYIDDILVAAATKDKLAKRAAEVQKRIEQVGLVINWDKSVKEAKSVEWLGHCLSEDGIKPTDKKADQIRALKHPACLKELRHVIGIFNYYGRYIKNMADIAHPIYERNRNHKNKAFIWGDKEQIALETIKSEICKQNVLVTFNTDRECGTILTCDTSELGM